MADFEFAIPHRVQKWPKYQEKMNKQTDPKLWSSIIRRLQKAKKMGMFPSGLSDFAKTGLFWLLLAKFGLLKAS